MTSPAQKCPYLSPILSCLSTGDGNAQCLHPEFHERCGHRHFADRRMGFVPATDLAATPKKAVDVKDRRLV